MKIIIDVMSGDNAPLELLKGAILGKEECHVGIAVVGDRDIIEKTAAENDLSLDGIEIIHADSVITMEDAPLSVIRDKGDSSMSVGLKMLAEGKGDAFVSAGNTGALLAGATLLVRRIRGIRRAAIATVLPYPTPVLLMDAGANLTVSADNLEQFAYMGSYYMEKVHGVRSPRIGLINNGTEPQKGLPLQVETYERLSKNEDLNFVGNIEGKEIPFSPCDVLLCDGFTGNIVLKYTEGMGKFLLKTLKGLFMQNVTSRVAALTMRGQLKEMKKQFDASTYGGAPILGISKPVIKAHGSSDAKAVKNAVLQTVSFLTTGINHEIAKMAAELEEKAAKAKEAASTETKETPS